MSELKKWERSKAIIECFLGENPHYTSALVMNGKLLKDMITGTPQMNFDEVVQDAKCYLSKNGSGDALCYQLTVTYAQRKVTFLWINDPESADQYWMLTTMGANRIYYIRTLKKVIKALREIIFKEV